MGVPGAAGRTLYTLYLPVHGADGIPISERFVQRIGERVARYTGGFTLLSPGLGMWIDAAGEVCRDLVTPLVAVAAAGPESERFFARLAADLAVELQQREVFIHAIPAAVVVPDAATPAPAVLAPLAARSVPRV